MTKNPFEKKLAEAKAYLRIVSPFFASLTESCPIMSDDSIQTACVNESGFIKINPSFFKSLSVTQSAVLLCHEVMHPAWGVFWRSRSLDHDPVLSNVAHDHVVNLILSTSHPDWSIPGWLCDPKYDNMSYEEVYCQIAKSPPSNKHKNKCGSIGLDIKSENARWQDDRKNENLWRERIAGACQSAWSLGSVPEPIQRAVTSLMEPQVNWKEWLFSRVSDSVSKTRCDWSIPSRRADALNFHWPREESVGVDISVAVDTSASVSAENLTRATAEIMNLSATAGATCRLIVCDAAVTADTYLEEFDPTILSGGGGTDFSPVFKHIEQYPTRLLIYFTDGQGMFPTEEPDYPVIWAVYDDGLGSNIPLVPFGEIVKIPA